MCLSVDFWKASVQQTDNMINEKISIFILNIYVKFFCCCGCNIYSSPDLRGFVTLISFSVAIIIAFSNKRLKYSAQFNITIVFVQYHQESSWDMTNHIRRHEVQSTKSVQFPIPVVRYPKVLIGMLLHQYVHLCSRLLDFNILFILPSCLLQGQSCFTKRRPASVILIKMTLLLVIQSIAVNCFSSDSSSKFFLLLEPLNKRGNFPSVAMKFKITRRDMLILIKLQQCHLP